MKNKKYYVLGTVNEGDKFVSLTDKPFNNLDDAKTFGNKVVNAYFELFVFEHSLNHEGFIGETKAAYDFKGKILEIETLNKQRFSAYYNIKFKDNNGKIQNWQMVSRNPNLTLETLGNDKVDAMTMLVVRKNENNENEYLITKEYRVPVSNYVISFPAGLVEKDEDPISAAIREIKEETGLICDNTTKFEIQRPIFSSPGITDELGQIMICQLSGKEIQSETELDASEDIESMWLTFNELENLLNENDYHLGSHAYVHILRLEGK